MATTDGIDVHPFGVTQYLTRVETGSASFKSTRAARHVYRSSLIGLLDVRDHMHFIRNVHALQLVVLNDILGPADSPVSVQ